MTSEETAKQWQWMVQATQSRILAGLQILISKYRFYVVDFLFVIEEIIREVNRSEPFLCVSQAAIICYKYIII
jgi:hypothetical protein